MKKLRIIEILIILITIKLTPIAINYANEIRHYNAFGGEYLIPILGLLFIGLIESICEANSIIKN